MRVFGVDANIMSLAGIAIAIGTMVDMGIVITENIHRHLTERPPDKSRRKADPRGDDRGRGRGVHRDRDHGGHASCRSSCSPTRRGSSSGRSPGPRPSPWSRRSWSRSPSCRSWRTVFLRPGRVRRDRRRPSSAASSAASLGALLYLWADAAVRRTRLPARRRPPGAALAARPRAVASSSGGLVLQGADRAAHARSRSNPVARGVVGAYTPVLRWVLAHKAALLGAAPSPCVLVGLMIWLGAADRPRARPRALRARRDRRAAGAPPGRALEEALPRHRARVHAAARRGRAALHAEHPAPRIAQPDASTS